MARVYVERRELSAELLHLLDPHPATAECTPPLDIIETDDTIEAILDLPGVPRSSIEIVFSRNVLLITGQKLPAMLDDRDAAFHIAERSFGRFARAISVDGSFDAGRATATLTDGQLHVVLPRLAERRGREIRIPIQQR
jgi:HSP20 family protein